MVIDYLLFQRRTFYSSRDQHCQASSAGGFINKELTMMLTPLMSSVSRKNRNGFFGTCQVHMGMHEWMKAFMTICRNLTNKAFNLCVFVFLPLLSSGLNSCRKDGAGWRVGRPAGSQARRPRGGGEMKHKHTNTNTNKNIQKQIHKYQHKHTDTNI